VRSRAIIAIGVALAASASARAAAEGDADAGLETITITATRTERTLYETPDTVSRVALDDFERYDAQSLGDVLATVPGVSFTGGPRAIAEEPNIRGLGGNRILITIDGARQDFDSAHKGRVFVETDLLKAVDVLRGPGSAVHGSGALGGVIALTTKDAADFLRPGERIGIRFKGGFQDVNEDRDASGMLFGVFDEPGIDYLLSATRRSSDDVRLGGGEILEDSAEDTWAGLAKLTWTPRDAHRLGFSRQYTFQSGEVPAQADARTSPTAVLTARETEVTLDRVAYDRLGDEDDAFAPSAFAYSSRQTIREQRIGTDGRLDAIDFDTVGADLRNSTTFGADGRVLHRLSYGIETHRDEMASTRGGEANPAFPDARSDFVGVYVQDEIEAGRWTLIPGARWDRYESRSEAGEALGVDARTRAERVSPKLGIVYEATDWLNATVSYGQAFRAPDFQELYVSGSHFGANEFVPNPDLDPEVLRHGVEAGVRIARGERGAGNRWWLRAGAYHNEYEDFIDSVVTVTTTSFDNVTEARIRGVELEARYFVSAWNLEGTLGASRAVGDRVSAGEPLASIPGASVTLDLRKEIPAHDLSVGWRARFHARQDRVPEGQPETESYDVHDLYATWSPRLARVHDLFFTLGVDNVGDARYTPHLSELPAPGRNVRLALTVQF
jgi:hemoglobin/transferrin/lactoferrin receptor protein